MLGATGTISVLLEEIMRNQKLGCLLIVACWSLASNVGTALSQEKEGSGPVQVHVVITDQAEQA
jgi:hypothetical protein